jgi:hypothetical protein
MEKLWVLILTTYPIPVWSSTTLDVAESHKINAQSACKRQLIKGSRSFYFS